MEVFNCVLLTGSPGYAWRVKKKFGKAKKSAEKEIACKNIRKSIKPKNKPFWCRLGKHFMYQGKQCLMITCYESFPLEREILNFKLKYNIQIEVLYSEITVKIPAVEPTLTGNNVFST